MIPVYRHKKGNVYRLLDVRLATRDYAVGEEMTPMHPFGSPFVVTDPITAGTFACCYQVDPSVATPENPMKGWARAAEMFFDGRFTRVSP